ncbi:YitT family protein [uncultured Enterococcus sp.]|uniref:YczE/YyaS/YitT family protein n=1 Tax=uncultured Enterococcus sp. TaxID=167972 RepID=UPI00374835C4
MFFYLISAFGISLSIKAAVGVSSFNSLNVALSEVTSLKVGTITTIINLSFLLMCWFLDKNRSWKGYLLMLSALLCFGSVINLILYNILIHVSITAYIPRLLLFVTGTLIAGFGTGQVLVLNYLKFPIENFCAQLAERTTKSFKYYRYLIDIVCVSLSLLLSLTFRLPIVVREGTLISLFLLSSVIAWSRKLRLVPEELPLAEEQAGSK